METPIVLESGETLNLVHFAYTLLPRKLTVKWQLACMESMDVLHSTKDRPFSFQRTDDVRAVTCPTCKTMDVYKAAKEELEAFLHSKKFVG